MANPPPPYANITGISRAAMKDNAQESITNYNGNARPGEMTVNPNTSQIYIGNTNGNLNLVISSNGANTFLGNVRVVASTTGLNQLYFDPINVRYSDILYMIKDDELKNLFIQRDNDKRLNFKITRTMKPEIYELHLNDKDTLTKVCYAYIKNIEMSKYIHDLLKDDGDIIVECEYNKHFEKWEPIKRSLQRIHHVNDLEIL